MPRHPWARGAAQGAPTLVYCAAHIALICIFIEIGERRLLFCKIIFLVVLFVLLYRYMVDFMPLKKTTIRLTPDADRVIKMHIAQASHVVGTSHAVNDIIERFGQLSEKVGGIDNKLLEVLLTLSKEQQSAIQQLTHVSLRNFALNIEIATSTDPNLASKGEARARQLLKQMQEKS
jgi:hypothetical protein